MVFYFRFTVVVAIVSSLLNSKCYCQKTEYEKSAPEVIKYCSDKIREGADTLYFYYKVRGDAFYLIELYDQALHDYYFATSLKKDYTEVYNNIGLVHLKKNSLDSAEVYFRIAGQMDNRYPEPYFNLGCVAEKRVDKISAIKYYSKAIEINSNYTEAYNNRGLIYLDNLMPDSAIADFTKAINLDSKEASYYLNRSIAYQKSARLQDALADAQHHVTMKNKDTTAYNQLGLVLLDLKRNAEACDAFGMTIKLGGTIPNYDAICK